jgi:diguanylate cyclase (GGDEF)-like protein
LQSSFFAVSYPIADLILASITLSLVASQGFSIAPIILTSGILTFAVTDFLYLWFTIQGTYAFGGIIDDGWLAGLVLIAESLWHHGNDAINEKGINPILIALSIILSATLLASIALKPDYFPHFVLFPAIITLLLAFIRMTIALRAAKNIGHERILARTDELTGLPNRRRLISEIENFVAKDGALLLLDLDGFKPVNDAHGHETGDKVLQQVALRFSRALPSTALLARLGGDEFGILYEGSNESAMEVALALRATLSYPFRVNSDEILIGVSIGVAANNGQTDLLKRADLAMYRAKREGLGVCRL